MERNCVLTVRDGDDKLFVSATNIIRKFDLKGRIAFVGVTTWILPSERLQFEDRLWTLISPASPESPQACTVQSCYQVRSMSEGAIVGAIARKQDLVMSTLGHKLRRVMETQQNYLLEQSSIAFVTCFV